ncbi:MAG TPA: hypothetical protein VHE79_08240 [Spirochaetia bacterium]
MRKTLILCGLMLVLLGASSYAAAGPGASGAQGTGRVEPGVQMLLFGGIGWGWFGGSDWENYVSDIQENEWPDITSKAELGYRFGFEERIFFSPQNAFSLYFGPMVALEWYSGGWEIPDYNGVDYNLWINYFAADVGLSLGARYSFGPVKILASVGVNVTLQPAAWWNQQFDTDDPIVYDLESDTDYQFVIASLPLMVGAEIPLPGDMAIDLTATFEVPLGMFGNYLNLGNLELKQFDATRFYIQAGITLPLSAGSGATGQKQSSSGTKPSSPSNEVAR